MESEDSMASLRFAYAIGSNFKQLKILGLFLASAEVLQRRCLLAGIMI